MSKVTMRSSALMKLADLGLVTSSTYSCRTFSASHWFQLGKNSLCRGVGVGVGVGTTTGLSVLLHDVNVVAPQRMERMAANIQSLVCLIFFFITFLFRRCKGTDFL